MLDHHRNAILNRIVAATASATQPRVRGLVGAGDERLMAHRANKDVEQSLRKNRRHGLSLDHASIALALKHFHFWCIQSKHSRRGFSSRKAALRGG